MNDTPVGSNEKSRGLLETAILFNDFCYVNGGASGVAIDTAIALARAGVRVKFLGAVGPVCEQLKHPQIEVTCLDQAELIRARRNPATTVQGLWNLQAVRAARQMLSGCDPKHSVVHIHGWTKALTSAPIRAATKLGFPAVLTLHDFFSACPNGAFYDYQANRSCSLRALSPRCIATHCDKRSYAHKAFRVVRGAVQKWPGGFPTNVRNHIALSDLSERIIRPYLPANARLFRLANTVGVDRAQRVRAGQNRTIVAVGRLDPEKGVELLVKAASLAGVHVTFVGDGQLRSLVEGHSHCTVTGWQTSTKVFEALRTARALVFPSLWYETYGLVVSEASALGVPAIVSNVTAAAERVDHGVTGWVFESGNAVALAELLRGLHDDASVDRVGNAAHQKFWASAVSPEQYIQQMLQIYDEVLSGSGEPGH